VLLLAAALLSAYYIKERRTLAEAYERIKLGDTREDVIRASGQPSRMTDGTVSVYGPPKPLPS